jgi:hypothetical protein
MIRTDQRPSGPAETNSLPVDASVIEAVAGAIGRLSYGVVQLTVHDGKVVQLDVTERQRFSR